MVDVLSVEDFWTTTGILTVCAGAYSVKRRNRVNLVNPVNPEIL